MESGAAALTGGLAVRVIEERRVGKLVLQYVIASTAFLFVAGALGMLLRESQADLVRIRPGVFYAIMPRTASEPSSPGRRSRSWASPSGCSRRSGST